MVHWYRDIQNKLNEATNPKADTVIMADDTGKKVSFYVRDRQDGIVNLDATKLDAARKEADLKGYKAKHWYSIRARKMSSFH